MEEDKDLNLTVAIYTRKKRFIWWKYLTYRCKVFSGRYKNDNLLIQNYIFSRVKEILNIKSEKGDKIIPDSRYITKLSTKWSIEKIDEAIWHFVDSVIQYKKGKTKIKWEEQI